MNKSNSTPAPVEGLVKPESGTTLARINQFLAAQPSVTDDPTETMLEAILASENPTEWERVFTSVSFKDSDKARVRINDYRPAESQFEGGLKWFLVLDVTSLESGVKGVMTCGSAMAIAQILNAKATIGLPIDVEVVRKETKTKAGFHPMRLRFIGQTETPLGDPHAVVSEQ